MYGDAMDRVMVSLPSDLLAAVDKQAKQLDRSRAWVIRDAVQRQVQTAPAPHPFVPQTRNTLRCDTCGGKQGEHR